MESRRCWRKVGEGDSRGCTAFPLTPPWEYNPARWYGGATRLNETVICFRAFRCLQVGRRYDYRIRGWP